MLRIGLKMFFVLVALVAILLGYYYFFDRNKVVPDIFDVFNETGMVIRFNQPNKLLTVASSSEVFQEALQNDSSLYYAAHFLQGLYGYQPYRNAGAMFIFADSLISPVYVIQNQTIGQSSGAIRWIIESFYGNYKTVEKNKNRQTYYTIYRQGDAFLYLSESNGVILWSEDVGALLKATATISKYFGKTNTEKLINTASQNSFANIFIRPPKLSAELGSEVFTNKENSDNASAIYVLDVHVKNNQIVLSGLSSVASMRESQVIAKAAGKEFSMPDVVPEQSDIVYQLDVHNLYDQFQAVGEEHQRNFNWLTTWANDEMVFFSTSSSTALAFKVKGQSIAKDALQRFAEQTEHKSVVKRYKFDKSTDFEIVQSDFNWVKALLPSFCNVSYNLTHAVLSGEYVVFASDVQFAQDVCRNTVLQQNLKSSYRFKEQSSVLSSSSNRLIYADLNSDNFESFFTQPALSFIRSTHLANLFQYMAWQSSGSGQYVYNHIVLYKATVQLAKSNVRWKTKLGHNARIKPVMVRNHATGKTEIMVQDENHYLYLINDKGRVLWKKLLDGNVLGEIVQVDKYKNGKLQYILNTSSKLYLIDRNGNDVERFPIQLPNKATAGLAVFDYEKNRNYRIFIPMLDRRMLLYDIDANLIPGWQFNKSDAIVTSPVQFVRVRNKDFIFFADSLRHYFLNRQGEHRIKPKQLIGKSRNNPIYFNAKTAQWISSNVHGHLVYTGLDGSVKVLPVDTLTLDHYFLYADINRDGNSDFVFIDNNMLKAYNHNYKQMYSYQFSNSILEAPSYYVFSQHVAGVGVVDKQAGKVYMFNSQGKQFNGYPYPGVTPFTISVMNGVVGFNLIVGNFDGFLYTYQQR